MKKQIQRKMQEWTLGLNALDARISVFEHVRDIPYAVVRELLDSDDGPARMLDLNKGSCQPKHFLLEQLLTALEVPVLYARYAFKWDELEMDYPPRLRKLAVRMPVTYHLACKAVINDRLVLVDATLDSPLVRLGLPVNEEWDGYSDLMLPVKALDEEIFHPSEKGDFTPPEFSDLESEFYAGLNVWLEQVRSEPLLYVDFEDN